MEMSRKRSPLIEFRRIGIGPKNGENTAGWKLKTLGTLIREEGLEEVSSSFCKVDTQGTDFSNLTRLVPSIQTFPIWVL